VNCGAEEMNYFHKINQAQLEKPQKHEREYFVAPDERVAANYEHYARLPLSLFLSLECELCEYAKINSRYLILFCRAAMCALSLSSATKKRTRVRILLRDEPALSPTMVTIISRSDLLALIFC
jgi:hypothetical protein